MGNAVLAACRDIQAKLRAMAARVHGVDADAITVEHGVVRLPDRERRDARRAGGRASAGSAASSSATARCARRPSRTTRSAGAPAFFEFNCTAIEAEVDEETGDVTLVRHVTVSDVGKAINPLQVRMQDEGAAIMGLGHTLMEHYIFDEAGRVRNLGAIDYRIPTSMDLPLELRQRDDRERGRARARTAPRA